MMQRVLSYPLTEANLRFTQFAAAPFSLVEQDKVFIDEYLVNPPRPLPWHPACGAELPHLPPGFLEQASDLGADLGFGAVEPVREGFAFRHRLPP